MKQKTDYKQIECRKCVVTDIDSLQVVSERTFYEAYSDACPEDEMKTYLKDAFNKRQLTDELNNPDSEFYIICSGDKLCGYMKLNVALAQKEGCDSDSLEVQRIYVVSEAQGTGMGSKLMTKAVERALARGKDHIMLGVWPGNAKALGFYKRHDFYKTGSRKFVLGRNTYENIIMRKDLEEIK